MTHSFWIGRVCIEKMVRTDENKSDASVGTSLISHARHCRSRSLLSSPLILHAVPSAARPLLSGADQTPLFDGGADSDWRQRRHASSAVAQRRSISAVMTRACCARRAAPACRPTPAPAAAPAPEAVLAEKLAPNAMVAQVAISAAHTSRYPKRVRTNAANARNGFDDAPAAGTSNE